MFMMLNFVRSNLAKLRRILEETNTHTTFSPSVLFSGCLSTYIELIYIISLRKLYSKNFSRYLASLHYQKNSNEDKRTDSPSSSSIRSRQFCLLVLSAVWGAPNLANGAPTATAISGMGSSAAPPARPDGIIK